jgi:serine phosphatase RsbU (regulator of sigma subunit)
MGTMKAAANERSMALDVERVLEKWRHALPEAVRSGVLDERELLLVLNRVERYLRTESGECLAELDAHVHRLARRVEEQCGHQATLRYLRDAPVRALSGSFRGEGLPLARVFFRITDAVWSAHAEALEETLRQARDDRLHQELMLAKRIQERLLPRTIPEVPGYDIAGRVLPATEVGGDYWSCRSYPEDDIVTFKLADVTGHGIAAATLVSAVKFISGGYYRAAKTAAQVMQKTNQVLVRETPHEILVTMVYGWLYPHSHEMTVVNAGHSPVLHYRSGRFCPISPTGVALGLVESRYREVRLTLEPGDVFFTCSDGITEPSAERALGEDWVREQVAAGAHLSAAELVCRVLEGALEYYGTPLDDMSLLVIKRSREGASPDT